MKNYLIPLLILGVLVGLYFYMKKAPVTDVHLTVDELMKKYGWDRSKSTTYLNQLLKTYK